MTRAIILAGADRYEGRWHDHAATAQRIAGILAEIGIAAEIRGTRPRVFGELADADLVIANTAASAQATDDWSDADWEPGWAALRDYVGRGGPLLALHLAASSFREIPEWRQWIGGEWVNGTSMHPPISEATVTVRTDAHPIVSGFGDFQVFDEMYSYLELEPGNTILAEHRYEERIHPLAWAREHASGRAVYDGLGHDVRSYDSPERVRLLQREVEWLTGEDDS